MNYEHSIVKPHGVIALPDTRTFEVNNTNFMHNMKSNTKRDLHSLVTDQTWPGCIYGANHRRHQRRNERPRSGQCW